MIKKEGKINNLNKKSQVTIFIIIGIIIVVLGILIYFFYPKMKGFVVLTTTPQGFIQNCIEEELENNIKLMSSQGGKLIPENYFLYEDNKIEYLCYTNEYYLPCVVQQPMLYRSVSNEIKRGITEKTKECLKSLKETYEKKGYQISMNPGEINVELNPKRIILHTNYSVVVADKKSSETFEDLRVIIDNNLYELLGIANNIISFETKYGDSETTIYMSLYPHIKVEKLLQTDGTTIYILTERNSKNKFQFASRSIAWPSGYGVV